MPKVASTGPRPRGRGIPRRIAGQLEKSRLRFNGAAPARAAGILRRDIRGVNFASAISSRFNGAAPAPDASQAKVVERFRHGHDIVSLQRGRARAGAEFGPASEGIKYFSTFRRMLQRGRARAGRGIPSARRIPLRPSTGPRPRGARNLRLDRRTRDVPYQGFNGAAPARARNLLGFWTSTDTRPIPTASTGPRPRGRGMCRSCGLVYTANVNCWLQRGRARAGRGILNRHYRVGALVNIFTVASTGPRPRGRSRNCPNKSNIWPARLMLQRGRARAARGIRGWTWEDGLRH